MPSNRAAYLIAKSTSPLVVKEAPYTPPAKDKIVVKNAAVAINPVDWIKIAIGDLMFSWIKYPAILGSDVSGEVVEIGHGVTRFHVGDRVVGHAVGTDKRSNKASEGAFQEYTVLQTNLTSPIPASMSYAEACVLPLGLSTAACGLFMKDYLALDYPTSPKAKANGKVLLVWGGSTSVGCNAIQLGVAAGYDVITTASPKNFALVKRLGAAQAFDYRSKTVVKDIIQALKGQECAGAIAIGNRSLEPCLDIIGVSKGRKFIAQASQTMPGDGAPPQGALDLISIMPAMVFNGANVALKKARKRVGVKFIWGSDLMVNEVGKAIYEDFLPKALAEGDFVPAPEPVIAGEGLEFIQKAMDMNRNGLSAKKAIVTL